MTVKNITDEFKYEYLTESDKSKLIDIQLKELETTHFGLVLIEPHKLNNGQEHLQWRQQKTDVENTIKRLRSKKTG